MFDDDIDIFNDLQVEWAMGTRFQANEDMVILEGMLGMTMDPSLRGRRTGAKAGFDGEVVEMLKEQAASVGVAY